jgi:3-methyladenine DNA glycosylase AlkD
MTNEELAHEIKSYCLANADPINVTRYSRYFKGGYNGYGLTTQQILDKSKELLSNKDVDLHLVFETMPLLFESGKYEEASLGFLVINGLHKQFAKETLNNMSRFFSMGINNWAHADVLSMGIFPKLMELQLATIDDFQNWVQSPYKFQRRCVPVTFIKLLKRKESFMELFTFLEPLMMDSEREVHQGMGWFLREAWKIKSKETEAFLMKWKNSAPRLIFQYACEKMTPAQKLLFKRVK